MFVFVILSKMLHRVALMIGWRVYIKRKVVNLYKLINSDYSNVNKSLIQLIIIIIVRDEHWPDEQL